ncbi:MAG: family 10 glycosylhydrolase [Proteobacteria bacterium]|nr:family 10 glycosylhydrolase [Pseudomonadota bacterium]MBU1547267.1 family 10 glycosylhydrolase [Pseudomonadota bacterium]MBU2618109.1 family 10 glycosylhydrolase [Pseudomonadota bacterium]
MPQPQPCSLRALLPALALLLLVSACAPRLRTAAWVVRFDLDSPAKIAALCPQAKQAGLDHLLVQVRGRADALYRSELAPRAGNLAQAPTDFDPLAQLLTECAPLSLHAWLNVFYLWGGDTPPESPDHPGHPGQPWILSDNTGRPVSGYSAREKRLGWIEGSYADPASAEYRALFVAVVRELLARYPVAGIHLDFIRYPGPGYGKSDPLAEQFERSHGVDPRLLPERIHAGTVTDWLEGKQSPTDRVLTTAALFWNEFRAGQVTQLLREVRQAVDHSGATGIVLSVAVFPEPAAAYLENGQEYQAWAAEGLVDRLYPMAYFGDAERVNAQLREITATTPRPSQVSLWAGLGALGKNSAQLGREARIAGENGYEGVALFSLGHLLKKNAALAGAEAVRAPRLSPVRKAEPGDTKLLASAPPELLPPNMSALKSIACKALGGFPPQKGLEAKLALRLQEYDHARQHSIPKTLNQLKNGLITVPERLTLGGIFRYASPMDSPARWQEQEVVCEKARQRLLAGEELAAVAEELSQDSSKTLGGLLAPRFLDLLDPQDQELAQLLPREISRVMRVANGFWCYRLEDKGLGRGMTFAEAPWEAKRILFRRGLGDMLEAGTGRGL